MLRVLIFSVLFLAITVQSQDICIDMCREEKPECSSGQIASGQPVSE
ncbi:hypothetical protein EYZ11_004715 [Aspergillus tanneri]|uniref:Uncharacterized protein n=1 Tax=Aspergillus tanneri TaxID=1220188 RepID=A0A4S3JKC1_9EURO|nr:hypothetical protein EYZ11_004715 [Aspergillus tanneri]